MLYVHPGREDARPGVDAEASGFVYVMAVDGVRGVKVGYTGRTPSARAADMHHTIIPAKLRVLAAWECGAAARRLERLMHKALVAAGYRRIGGEFFDATLPTVQHELERVAAAHGIAVEPWPGRTPPPGV